MKLTVFALLLVVMAFSVLAAIFRSGMRQFDPNAGLRPVVSSERQGSARFEKTAVTEANQTALRPWLRPASTAGEARRERAHSGADHAAGVEPDAATEANLAADPGDASHLAPAETDVVEGEMEAEAGEPVVAEVTVEDLLAWRQALQEREAALLQEETAQVEWVEEQQRLLAEQSGWVEEQLALIEEQEALVSQDQALLEAQALENAAVQAEQEALWQAEQLRLEEERALLEEAQRRQQTLPPGILVVSEIDQRRGGTGTGGGQVSPDPAPANEAGSLRSVGPGRGPGFAPPIATAAPPIRTAAPPIPTAAPPIPTAIPSINRSAPPINRSPSRGQGNR